MSHHDASHEFDDRSERQRREDINAACLNEIRSSLINLNKTLSNAGAQFALLRQKMDEIAGLALLYMGPGSE